MELVKEIILQYGYFGILLALVGGIIGLPIPDEILLITIGYYAYIGRLTLITALISSYIGAIIGITVSYLLGIKLGLPFLLKYGSKIRITPARVEQAQYLFQKHGPWLLVIGYFIPGVRHITGYLAGISKMRFHTFMLYSYVGALIWVILFILIGHELGVKWFFIKQSFETYKFLVYSASSVLLVAIALLCLFFYRNRKKR
ncbi:DedA family protein [Bacillus solitudinis]|uniref:DedA family protein n=1 Tax=Bacillus solitudinis TaxID=2014074 RepID=UPI000C24F12B|nr:DedA family protein [Bacillus solitudinis]